MRRFPCDLVALTLVLSALGVASANAEAVTDPKQAQDTSQMAQALFTQAADPSLSSNVAEETQITLLSTEENSVVTGSLTVLGPNGFTFSVKLQAPIEKGQEEVELANLDGLANSATATLSLSKVFWKETEGDSLGTCRRYNEQLLPHSDPIDIAGGECTAEKAAGRLGLDFEGDRRFIAMTAAQVTCEEFNKTGQGRPFLLRQQAVMKRPDGTMDLENLPGFRAVCSPEAIADLDRDLVARGKAGVWVTRLAALQAERLKPFEAEIKAKCEEYNRALPEDWIDLGGGCKLSALSERGRQWFREGRREAGLHRPWLTSVSVSTSRKGFKFADPQTLEEGKETKNSYALSGSVGVLTFGGTFYSASYRREHLFKGQPATEICSPLDGTDSLACRNLALGGPTETRRELAQLEGRRYFGEHAGGALRVTHDFDEEVWGYQFLVFLLQNKDGGLNGGFDLGYRDDTDDFTARVFIGKSFKLLNGG